MPLWSIDLPHLAWSFPHVNTIYHISWLIRPSEAVYQHKMTVIWAGLLPPLQIKMLPDDLFPGVFPELWLLKIINSALVWKVSSIFCSVWDSPLHIPSCFWVRNLKVEFRNSDSFVNDSLLYNMQTLPAKLNLACLEMAPPDTHVF